MADMNIFGQPVITCSVAPLTGYFRDGCCNTDETDLGSHTVCIVVTEKFLRFSFKVGNDLSTPLPEYNFQGLKPGDRWCLCAERFLEAYNNDAAPKVVMEATNESALEIVSMEILLQHAFITSEVND
jgi:uncharacterized protein (DUF2237 family)